MLKYIHRYRYCLYSVKNENGRKNIRSQKLKIFVYFWILWKMASHYGFRHRNYLVAVEILPLD